MFRSKWGNGRVAIALTAAGLLAGPLPGLAAPAVAAAPGGFEAAEPGPPVEVALDGAFEPGDSPESAVGSSAEPSTPADEGAEDPAPAVGRPLDEVRDDIEAEVAAATDALPEVQPGVYTEVRHEGDGHFEVVTSDDPLYRPEGDGTFTELDGEVQQTPGDDGSLAAPGILAPATFGGEPGALLSMEVGGSTVTLTAPDLAVGEPTRLSDTEVTFGEIAPGVELRYATGRGEVQERLVITSPDAARSFRFVLEDPDGVLGEVSQDAEGRWRFSGTGDDAQALLTVPPAFAYEADAETLAPRPVPPVPGQPSAHLEIRPIDGGFELVQSVDETWFEGRELPIVLDPSIRVVWGRPSQGFGADPITDGYVGQQTTCPQPTTCVPFTDFGTLFAGAAGDFRALRSLLAWQYGPLEAHHGADIGAGAPFNVPERADIDGASLWLKFTGCMNGVTPMTEGADCGPAPTQALDVHPLTMDIDPPGVHDAPTWAALNGITSPTPSSAFVDSDRDRAHHPVDLNFNNCTPAPPDPELCELVYGNVEDWHFLPITDVVQGWVNNPAQGAGLVIRARDENRAAPNGATWASSLAGTVVNRPYLAVDYQEVPPGPPTNLSASAVGTTVNVDWGESTTGTWAIWYHAVLVDADTHLVAAQPELRDLPLGHTTDWSWPNVAPGRYYVSVVPSNHGGTGPAAVSPIFTVGTPAGPGTDDAGFEPWFTFESTSVGPQAAAGVNVANGNLVVQQTDTTPVQGHGRLGYVVRRTYNSTDGEGAGLMPSGVARGWSFNISSAGMLGGGLAAGLVVPDALESALRVPVTLVDRDGTRHTFTPREDVATITIGSGNGTTFNLGALDELLRSLLPGLGGGGDGLPALLDDLQDTVNDVLETVLTNPLDLLNLAVCLDTSYDPPSGVDLALWRFVAVQIGDGCDSLESLPVDDLIVLGYATMRPDRVRQTFAITGQVTSETDAAGNELRYRYEFEGPAGLRLGRPTMIYEPAACPTNPTADPTCRAIRFDWPPVPGGDLVITDPAGRRITYDLDFARRLLGVTTRTANGALVESWSYGYQGVAGVNCEAAPGVLCRVTDPRGNTTQITYHPDGKVATVADRFSASDPGTPSLPRQTSSFTYVGSTTTVTRDGRARRYYLLPDASNRVHEVRSGSLMQLDSDQWRTRTQFAWDTDAEGACQMDGRVDRHRLCRRTESVGVVPVDGAPGGYVAPVDRVSQWTYTPEGAVLTESVDGLTTTYGYSSAHLVPPDTLLDDYDTEVRFDLGGVLAARPASVMHSVIDRITMSTPGGRQTSYAVDADYDRPVGSMGGSCGAGNSGLLCRETRVTAPQNHVTTHTYDQFGQRTTTTAPDGGVTTYTYYGASALDLSGNTRAAGWLRAVTDPVGEFVAFGYDRAGNVVRTWDRNATHGFPLSQFPGTVAAPPVASYTETSYRFDDPAPAFANPWRWPALTRDQLGRFTIFERDANGNLLRQISPAARVQSYTYTARDQQATMVRPLAPGDPPSSSNTWTTHYDGHGLPVASIDARSNVTTTVYDLVGRPIEERFTRGLWVNRSPREQERCVESTAAHAPIPLGRTVCTRQTAYDGAGRVFATTDAAGAVTWLEYDGTGRQVATYTPHMTGVWRESRNLLDGDGNVLTACTARQEPDEGPCTAASHYATHAVYDGLSRPTSQTTWRRAADPAFGTPGAFVANTSSFSYAFTPVGTTKSEVTRTDPRGFATTERYDALGRLRETVTPRTGTTSVRTVQYFDYAGNVIGREVGFAPAQVESRTAWRYDAAHRVVDVVEAASSLAAAANTNSHLAVANPPTNTRTRYLYDQDGLQVGVYDSRAFTVSVTDPDERYLRRTDFDGRGRPIAQWQPFYDTATLPLPVAGGPEPSECPTPSSGHQPANVSGVPAYPATTGLCVTRAAYDSVDNLTVVTNPTAVVPANSGRFISYTYTNDNLVRTVAGPDPRVASGARVTTADYQYDAAGRPTQVTDAAGWVTQSTWTADGLVEVEASRATSASVFEHRRTFTYNEVGQEEVRSVDLTPANEMDAQVQTFTSEYYADGLLYESRTPDVPGQGALTTRYAYDQAGNATRVWSPSAVAAQAPNTTRIPTVNTYTGDGLLASTIEPVVTATDQRRWTGFEYDALGRKRQETVRLVTGETQGTMGTAGDGATIGFTFSPQGWPLVDTGRTGGPGNAISRTYDPAGNLTSVVDSSSGLSTIGASYYLNSQPLAVAASDNTPTVSSYATTFRYHGDGVELARMYDDTAPAGIEAFQAFTYNDARALTGVVHSGWTDPAVRSWTYTSDAAGRRVSELGPTSTGNAGTHLTEWAWNADGTINTKTLYAGVTSATGVRDRWTYAYDVYDRITQRIRTGTATTGLNQTYSYDPAGRLVGFAGQTFGYDHNSNRINANGTAYSYRADNSIRNKGAGALYTYYDFGGVRDDGPQDYTYDGFGRVFETVQASKTTIQRHDGLGRTRSTFVSQASQPADEPGERLQYYVGLSDTLSHVMFRGAAAPVYSARYVTSPAGSLGVYNLVGAPATPATLHTLHEDGQGDTVLLDDLNASTSAVICPVSFDPWGNTATSPPCPMGTSSNTIWYRGQHRTQGTGTYTFGARTYNPSTATWLTPDTSHSTSAPTDLSIVTDPLTANRYSYVNGDPVNFIDPSGHVRDRCIDGRCDVAIDVGNPTIIKVPYIPVSTHGETFIEFESVDVGEYEDDPWGLAYLIHEKAGACRERWVAQVIAAGDVHAAALCEALNQADELFAKPVLDAQAEQNRAIDLSFVLSIPAGALCGAAGFAVAGPAGAGVGGSLCGGAVQRGSAVALSGGGFAAAVGAALDPSAVLTDAGLGLAIVVPGSLGRVASTSWGRTIQDFQQYGDQWRRVSAHAEGAVGHSYRGGTSIEEVFERGTDRLVRHQIYGPNGDLLHETFRPYAKFGGP